MPDPLPLSTYEEKRRELLQRYPDIIKVNDLAVNTLTIIRILFGEDFRHIHFSTNDVGQMVWELLGKYKFELEGKIIKYINYNSMDFERYNQNEVINLVRNILSLSKDLLFKEPIKIDKEPDNMDRGHYTYSLNNLRNNVMGLVNEYNLLAEDMITT